jgi:hypothetical protein
MTRDTRDTVVVSDTGRDNGTGIALAVIAVIAVVVLLWWMTFGPGGGGNNNNNGGGGGGANPSLSLPSVEVSTPPSPASS